MELPYKEVAELLLLGLASESEVFLRRLGMVMDEDMAGQKNGCVKNAVVNSVWARYEQVWLLSCFELPVSRSFAGCG